MTAHENGATPTCEAHQWEVCRLAIGAHLELHPPAVARHVRDCTTCDAFVEELSRLRRWLATTSRPGERATRVAEPGQDLEDRARQALARELLARLARDLLALGRGATPRARAARVRDTRRLTALAPAGSRPAWADRADAVRLAHRPGPVDRDRALGAAAQLDPVGLDVALAWLGSLERAGRGPLAQRLTDRLLCGPF